MPSKQSPSLTAAQEFELKRLRLRVELEARKIERQKVAHQERSILEYVRDYQVLLAAFVAGAAAVLSALIGGVFSYISREPSRETPAAVQPQEQPGSFRPEIISPVEPRDKPEVPITAPTFGYQLIGIQIPDADRAQPLDRVVQNAGTLAAAGNAEQAAAWLKKYLEVLGYAKADDEVVMPDWNTFRVVERSAVSTDAPSGARNFVPRIPTLDPPAADAKSESRPADAGKTPNF